MLIAFYKLCAFLSAISYCALIFKLFYNGYFENTTNLEKVSIFVFATFMGILLIFTPIINIVAIASYKLEFNEFYD